MPQVDDAVIVRDKFPPSEPPTLSTRGPSGSFVKRRVILALSESHGVMKDAYAALDDLLHKLQYKARKRHSTHV